MEKAIDNDGVDEVLGYVVVSETFLRETLSLVRADLKNLMRRYREWRTAYPTADNFSLLGGEACRLKC